MSSQQPVKKIAIDARMYGAAATTGIGVYIERLVKHLAELDQRNQYVLLLRQPMFDQVELPGKNFHKLLADIPWYSWSEQVHLPRLLRSLRPDLVHFPHFNVPLLYRGAKVVTIHDLTPLRFPGPRTRRSPWRRWAYHLVLQQAIRSADRILVISDFTGRQLAENFSVASDRVAITPLGTGQQFSGPATAAAVADTLKRYGISQQYLLYAGVWRDHKNIPGLVAAYNKLRQSSHFCQLVLTGKPDPLYPEIIRTIHASPYRAGIKLPGFVSASELQALYTGAVALVLPSFSEGFGLAMVEAAACGTAVAASATTSSPEVMGSAAAYFDPHSSDDMARVLARLLVDQAYRRQLVGEGMRVVRQYSWRHCAERTLQVYLSALNVV